MTPAAAAVNAALHSGTGQADAARQALVQAQRARAVRRLQEQAACDGLVLHEHEPLERFRQLPGSRE